MNDNNYHYGKEPRMPWNVRLKAYPGCFAMQYITPPIEWD